MESNLHKSDQKLLIQQAVTASADFLSQYLALANAHPVDFIVLDAWNKILPTNIQTELCALTKQQLLQLPSSYTSFTDHHSVQPDKEAAVWFKAGNSVNQVEDHQLDSGENQMDSGPVCPDHCLSIQSSKETVVCNETGNGGNQIGDLHFHSDGDQTHSNSEKPHHVDTVRTDCGDKIVQNEVQPCSESRNTAWKHGSLRDFLTGVREHCLENLQCLKASVDSLSSWLQDRNGQGSDSVPFVHAFMKEKKMHEVEIMADLCAQMFNKSSADVVVDLGSGKGYLSTHLSLQCRLPVIGIDSQPHNTSGAVQRAVKMEKQWGAMVKHEQKKVQNEKENIQAARPKTSDCNCLPGDCSAEMATGQAVVCNDSHICDKTCVQLPANYGKGCLKCSQYQRHQSQTTKAVPQPDTESNSYGENQKVRSESTQDLGKLKPDNIKLVEREENLNETENQTAQLKQDVNEIKNQTAQLKLEKENETENQMTQSRLGVNETENQMTQSKLGVNETENQMTQSKLGVIETENQMTQSKLGVNETENQMTQSKLGVIETEHQKATQSKVEDIHETENQTTQSRLVQKNVAVTMFINPDTKLTDIVKDSENALCPTKPAEDVRLLLTGLHTCGPLASSMLRLFVTDSSVRAMCGVGCCYQLMQERFVQEGSGLWQDPQTCQELGGPDGLERQTGDFPLSSVLLDRKMVIGRTALNIASLSLPRMTQSDEELQGKTFYPRALLQAFIHKKLGHVPQDLKKLRKLAKQAKNPPDYVRRALQKLNITGCHATEDEIRQFHEEYSHLEGKMACFFQLRAALAPLVESVVLLDRLLYLLEQDSVEEAFLVRLFDPVTSPRCHAIVAIKKELDQ